MGHLTYISDETCKLFEKCGAELESDLHGIFKFTKDYIHSESWHEYVTHALRQTQESDKIALGGVKPEAAVTPNTPKFGAVDDDFKPMGSGSASSSKLNNDVMHDTISMTSDSFQNDQVGLLLTSLLGISANKW
jgi:hypothetical protein